MIYRTSIPAQLFTVRIHIYIPLPLLGSQEYGLQLEAVQLRHVCQISNFVGQFGF
jgi:hypothetical protein